VFKTILNGSAAPRLALGLFLCLAAVALAPAYAGEAAAEKTAESEKAGEAETLGQALSRGSVSVALRYRFEGVEDDLPVFEENRGSASTLRTALRYDTAKLSDFQLMLEFQDVTDIGLRTDHNNLGAGSLWNGVSDRPIIADPGNTSINQALLRWTGLPETTLAAGRREILFDNVRFVGNVVWRQTHQSFDTFYVQNRSIPMTTITYAYVGQVNLINGGSEGMKTSLLNVGFDLGDIVTVTGYGYFLDYSDRADFGLSTRTLGLRVAGRTPIGKEWNIAYEGEYADQREWRDNPNAIKAGYYHLAAGTSWAGWTFKLGLENLGGSPEDGAFRTPLATLHAWNGWADRFVITPANGLRDTYLSASGEVGGVSLTGLYHRFDADSGGGRYGSELDFLAGYTAPWKQGFFVKLAVYSADEWTEDVTKIWLYTSYEFNVLGGGPGGSPGSS
jgi:hypothetical protein